MKIARIRWAPYRIPFRVPYTTAAGTATHREGLLLELTSDGGLIGLGEAAPVPEAGFAATDLAAAFAPIAGSLVEHSIHERAIVCASSAGLVQASLACAIDTAVCDLLAQSRELSVASWLLRDAAPLVQVNALVGATDLSQAVRDTAAASDAGYRSIKLKVGTAEDNAAECARVVAVRRAIGPEVKLRLDANGAWNIATAIEVLRTLAPVGIEYVEQPLPPGHFEALRYLQDRVDVPIAADEDVTDYEAARRIIDSDAARVLILKPQRLGGPRTAMAILEAARGRGVACVVTTSIEAGIGTAACLQLAAAAGSDHAHGLATLTLLESSLIDGDTLEASNGAMKVPQAPGLGVKLDDAALARYSEGWHEVT